MPLFIVFYYCAAERLRSIVMSMSVCLSVCLSLSARITQKPHGQTSPNFLCVLPVAEARSSSDTSRYVMYFRFYGWRRCRAIKHDVMFMRSFPRDGRLTSRARATGRSASSQPVLLPRRPRARDVGRARVRQSTRKSVVMTLANLPLPCGLVAVYV